MSFSQSLSFQDDDFLLSQSFSQFNFQDFTLPSQTQASQLDHHIGSQVISQYIVTTTTTTTIKILRVMTHNFDDKKLK